MAFDAVNELGQAVYQYDNWLTLLSSDDQPPDLFDIVEDPEGDETSPSNTLNGLGIGLNATLVIQSAGGQSLDFARMQWALAGHLVNRVQPPGFARMVEVRLPDLDDTRLHLGDYVTESESVNEDGESLTGESHLRPYHFGGPFLGQRVWDTVNSQEVLVADPPIFNPMVDGRVLPSMSDKVWSSGTSRLWIHPEAARTENAEAFQEQIAESWTLKEAVLAMWEQCNLAETFVLNPTQLDVLDDAPPLENVQLPKGEYLPFYLDRLLQPLGYNWFVEYNVPGETKPRIQIFKRGEGSEKELLFQAPGELLNLNETNVRDYVVDRRIGDSVNSVTVFGDVERYEVSISLWPTWPAEDDSLTTSDLNKQTGASYEGKENVHRKWAANEAGDYSSVRSDALIAETPQLQDVFTVYIPHRRTPEEPLTYLGGTGTKHRRPIYLEYSDDAGSTYQELTDEIAGNLLLLPDELGILFNSDEPPSALIDAGTDARIRMTCTLAGDYPIQYTAAQTGNAVNARPVELVLDLPQKFQKRQVWTEGLHASVLADAEAGADEVDHTDAIETFATDLRTLYEVAELDCEFRLPGWHTTYGIGDLLTNIAGREVSLDQAPTGGTARYPQIVERRFEMGDKGPQTVLVVDRGVRDVTA